MPPSVVATLSTVSPAANSFQAFLHEPVATPSVCPSNQNGTTDGRTSVWAGRVDLSVFVSPTATAAQTEAIRTALRTDPRVRTIYFETKKQAFAEFQRLYTCWAGVPHSAAPASFRVDLGKTVTIVQRNDLAIGRKASESN